MHLNAHPLSADYRPIKMIYGAQGESELLIRAQNYLITNGLDFPA